MKNEIEKRYSEIASEYIFVNVRRVLSGERVMQGFFERAILLVEAWQFGVAVWSGSRLGTRWNNFVRPAGVLTSLVQQFNIPAWQCRHRTHACPSAVMTASTAARNSSAFFSAQTDVRGPMLRLRWLSASVALFFIYTVMFAVETNL